MSESSPITSKDVTPVDLDKMEEFIASDLDHAHYQRVKPMLAEIRGLRASVEEWLCEACNTVYPGPPQPGFACVQCPKCKGITAPRQTIELRRAVRERDEALVILGIALPGPRPWPTEGVEAKLRIYRNMARDRCAHETPDEDKADLLSMAAVIARAGRETDGVKAELMQRASRVLVALAETRQTRRHRGCGPDCTLPAGHLGDHSPVKASEQCHHLPGQTEWCPKCRAENG